MSHPFTTLLRAIACAAALCTTTPTLAADAPVMPQRRFTTQELVRWNAGVRVVAPEQWAEIDQLLNEHRTTVRRDHASHA